MLAPPAEARDAPARSAAHYEFDIPAQSLATALSAYARITGAQILYDYARLAPLRAPALNGVYTRDEALARLLAHSGYAASVAENGIVRLQETARPQPIRAELQGEAPFAGARPFDEAARNGFGETGTAGGQSETITVTGTQIRGQAPVGANLITLDREAIEASGLATTEELLRTLPQNFGGGFAQHVSFQGGNIGGGSSVNLRGLGPDATLTLVNGRRLPVMGLRGNFADISSVPVSAIERVEVLPDSASAIYGSDAVGGVVNFVLRRDFDGLELGARYGGVTEGDLRETRLTGAAGHAWGPLTLFAAYEYFDRTALAMADRAYLADSDLSALGGDNFDLLRSNPTTLIVSGLGVFAVPFGQDGRNLTQAQLLAGQTRTANANEGLDALPDTEQHAVYLGGELELAPTLALVADARFATRDFTSANAHNSQRITIPASNAFRAANTLFPGRTVQADYDFYRDLGPRLEIGTTETTDLALALRWDILGSWSLEPQIAYGRVVSDHERRNMVNTPALNAALASGDVNTAFNPFGDGAFTDAATLAAIRGFAHNALLSETWSVAVKADGDLFALPGGMARLAAGADYRHEFFQIVDTTRITTLTPVTASQSENARNVEAAFVELLIPIFGENFSAPVGDSLDLSLAARIERYSDFGDTANPKIGIDWGLTDALHLRASWGESFRAPNLADLDPDGSLARRQVRGLNIADTGAASGRSNIILILGANPDLREQTAESWSAGLSYAPPASGMRFDLNYFDVRFSDRIASITNVAAALNPSSEFASLIDRTPDPARVAALLSEAAARGTSGGFSAADISVIVDARSTNLAVTDVRGMDVHAAYGFDLGGGELNLQANATYLFEFLRAASPAASALDVAGTIGNPVDWRARLGASWRAGRYNLSAFANYTGGFDDNLSTPARSVDAWTTIDLHAGLELGEARNASLSLSVINIFDEDPPFANNAAGFGYDPANADPLGRFVALELTTRF